MSEVTTASPDPDENHKNGKDAPTPLPGASRTGGELIKIDKSLQAEASSAHSRITVPLNLANWKHLSEETQNELCWFHQHLLDTGKNWEESAAAIRYDRTTVFKILKGNYVGSWPNVCERIRSHREMEDRRNSITSQEFAPNSISRMIWAGLDYALTNGSITTIVGESRMGKTMAVKQWCKENGGRAVFVTVPPLGGAKALVRAVATQVGVSKNTSLAQMIEAVYRGFNENRILVADEAHRCLPTDLRTVNPAAVEFMRDLKDQTGAGLALVSTQRLSMAMKKGAYQYEQLEGRIGMPILLKPTIKREDMFPIIKQFLAEPSAKLMDELHKIANQPGRLGIMVEILRVASRMAFKAKTAVTEETVWKAIALRRQMSGEEGK